MQVSRLPVFLFLILVGVCIMVFSPVIAGEHPWDDDRYGGGGGTKSDSNTVSPGDPGTDDPDGGGDLYGTIFYWWQFVIDQPYVDNDKTGRNLPAHKADERGVTQDCTDR